MGCAEWCAVPERDIFLNALEIEDPAARGAYLDTACAGRPALRQRVEELLRSHQEAESFLNVPALEQVAAAEQSLTFLGPPSRPDAPRRLDHYDVLELVGQGATGLVLKARDTKLQRVVAIKALSPRLAASDGARRRFVGEAQAAAAVRDDHVVAIHAVGDDGPVPYLVMEYICGMTLAQRVQQGQPLGLAEILRIGMQVARGLAAAHAQGLVHRDIKPANILLENGVQRVKITDFGLARAADDAGSGTPGTLAGTPAFMSPEQSRGEGTDHRSDLFSLGSVLYTLCTGRPPFRADTTEEVLRRVREELPQPIREINPRIPEALSHVVDKLLAKTAAERFASADEVGDVLAKQLASLQESPPNVPPHVASGPLHPTPKSAAGVAGQTHRRRDPLLAAGGLALLLAGGALAAYLAWWRDRGPDPLPDTRGRGDEQRTRPGRQPAAPLDLRRQDIAPRLLVLAGGGRASQAPAELAAVLGDGRFLLPRAGAILWMQQSPDEKILAVPLEEDLVLFEVQTGNYLRTLNGPGGRVVWVSFSRDSQLLAVTTWYEGWNGAVRVWDLRSDKELFTKPVSGPKIRGSSAFSADGRHLVAEGSERLHVWDGHSGQETQTVRIVPGGCGQICFSPDGRRLAAALWNGRMVKVFDWDGERLVESRSLQGHSLPVLAVAYSPDGKYLASGTEKEFKIWKAESLRETCAVETAAQELAFTPDSRTLYASATTSKQRPVHTWTRWDTHTRSELPALSVEVAVEPAFAFHCLSRDAKVLFLARGEHDASHVRAIDTASGTDLVPRRGHVAPVNAVVISPDGQTLASAGADWEVKVWELGTGRVVRSLSGHAQAVWGLAFSPDGNRLASASRDGTIILWDVAAGKAVGRLNGPSRGPSRIAFSPDGMNLAAGSESGVVQYWDAATGNPSSPLAGHSGAVRCVAYSPDGRWLASGGEDRTVRLHDLRTGRSRKLQAVAAVNAVAFSRDSRVMAAVGDAPEAALRLWDLVTGEETTCQGHTGNVVGLAFSPVAPLLATCAEDGTVRLWDCTGGMSRGRRIGPGPFGGGVGSVTFTPDGRYLATANANGTVYLLRVDAPPGRGH
jgi:WD40 repeat protein/tRNA A-37 threonylcarbamoyl transferase component Bud32